MDEKWRSLPEIYIIFITMYTGGLVCQEFQPTICLHVKVLSGAKKKRKNKIGVQSV